MEIRHLILDWSGTLVDDLPPVLESTNHVLATFGAPTLTLAEFRRDFCLPARKFYESRLPGVPQDQLEEIWHAHFQQHRHDITILTQSLGFLEFCRETGFDIYIATAIDSVTYQILARQLGIDRYVTKAYVGLKDKTETVPLILSENRLAPEQTLFVGDMEHDIEAGRAGGIWTCAVLTGYTLLDKLRAAEPDMICEHLGELQTRLTAREMVHG